MIDDAAESSACAGVLLERIFPEVGILAAVLGLAFLVVRIHAFRTRGKKRRFIDYLNLGNVLQEELLDLDKAGCRRIVILAAIAAVVLVVFIAHSLLTM